jgi:hypothetical protein
MNDVFTNLVLMARTGKPWEAAQVYSDLSGINIQEARRTMQNIYKVFQSKRVRNANQTDQDLLVELPEQEIDEGI